MNIVTTEEFKLNYQLDITKLVETRPGSFEAKYLSWANAQNLLRERHPTLCVEFEKNHQGTPVFEHGNQAYLLVFITDGTERTPGIFYPVMTNSFDAVENPSVTQINKACQRATAKAIAVYTGIGLKLFVGEDLTPDNEAPRQSYDQPDNATENWQEFKVPVGKHRGKTLEELMKEAPAYVTGFLLTDKFEFKSQRFEDACKAALAATGATAADIEYDNVKTAAEKDKARILNEETDEISGQTADDQSPDTDEIPF